MNANGADVFFVVSRLREVSVRFRVVQYLPHLRSRGLRAEVAEWDGGLAHRLSILRAASRARRVLVHRVLMSPPEAALLRRFAPGYRFDFDDALMFRDSARGRPRSWQRRAGLARMLRGAARVTAGNRYLAGWAARHQSEVTVVPTVVDVDAWPAEPPPAPGAVIGWIGTRSNLVYLERVARALGRIGRGSPAARLKIVCDAFPEIDGIEVERKPWSLEHEAADVRSFRVGIMPLSDDPWTRGKCGLKILQCFAGFVPVVCSPIGTNREIVRHGENGYFADGEEDWVARLEELLATGNLCQRMGARGRETVEDRYSLRATLPLWLDALGL